MLQEIKQRDYIENFLEFVRTFLIKETVTILEVDLVEANLDLLKNRIASARQQNVPSIDYSPIVDMKVDLDAFVNSMVKETFRDNGEED